MKFRFSPSPKVPRQPRPRRISIDSFNPYKMAPWRRNNLPELWKSSSALHFYLCIDRDVQKQHRTALIKKRLWRKCFSRYKHSVPAYKHWPKLSLHWEHFSVWSLVTAFGFKPQDERSRRDVCGSVAVRTNWVGMEEGAKECACQVDPEGGARVRLMVRRWWPQPWLDVELCDRPLSARVRVLAVDALAVALHLGQVLVEDLARPQGRHEVIELAAVVLAVCLSFAGLALPFPLLFELRNRGRTKMESEQSSFCYLPHNLRKKKVRKYSVNAKTDLKLGLHQVFIPELI